MEAQSIKNKGWLVVTAGLAINLALGILYSWSVFKDSIAKSIEQGGENAFHWDKSSLNDPYAVCVLVFAFSMILAGKIQDQYGPRITAILGGLLVGVGFFILSLSNSYGLWVLGFGIFAGMGIGFGYSAATPPALKWFPSSKTGMIAGIVVSGFGLAPVYIAPLATYLVNNFGLQQAMLVFAVLFVIVVCGAAFFLQNPPAEYVSSLSHVQAQTSKIKLVKDVTIKEIFKTPTFLLIWFIYFVAAGVGLMVIPSISGIAKSSMGEMAFLAVAVMAVGNALGRVVAGMLSDKIGKVQTLLMILLFQTLLMLISVFFVNDNSSALIVVLLATFIGFNYGTNLSLFPSFTKSFWGMKNFGMNYGFVMTAWGLGGFIFSRVSQMLFAKTGSHNVSFIIAGVCLLLCAGLSLRLKKMETKQE